jgi:DNA-binding response OmpR family regulator
MISRRILVIEDDPRLATIYQLALSSAGFHVDVAGDGLTALEDIDEGHPDLVILKLKLPQLDGRAILREAAATPDTCHIPFIVIAGDESERVPGTSTVLLKPFDPALLVAAVEQQFHKAAAA